MGITSEGRLLFHLSTGYLQAAVPIGVASAESNPSRTAVTFVGQWLLQSAAKKPAGAGRSHELCGSMQSPPIYQRNAQQIAEILNGGLTADR